GPAGRRTGQRQSAPSATRTSSERTGPGEDDSPLLASWRTPSPVFGPQRPLPLPVPLSSSPEASRSSSLTRHSSGPYALSASRSPSKQTARGAPLPASTGSA